jgi:hypothetical protein
MSETTALGIAAVARALAQQRGPTDEDRRIQAGIDAAMRGVIAEQTDTSEGRVKNPTDQRIPPHLMGKSREPLGHLGNELLVIPRERGFAPEVPITSPLPKGSFIEGVVNRMVDNALGPAVPKKREEKE